MAKAKRAVPEGYHTVTPTLVQDDTAKAIEWYKRGLGAEELTRAVGADGKMMHAEIRVGDSRITMNDAMIERCSHCLHSSRFTKGDYFFESNERQT